MSIKPTNGESPAAGVSGDLSHLQLLGLFAPLAFSAVMMVIAMQFISAGIARLPEAQMSLAAYGVVMAISIFLEAPIIVIIHVANSLVRGPVSYRRVFAFSVLTGGLLSLIHALIALTPLYDLVFKTIIGLPEGTADLGRAGFLIMTPWTVAIAWRRFFQGILVHHGHTGLVGRGTAIRLALALGVLGIGMLFPVLPGVTLGPIALSISVTAEAAVVTWFARPLIRRLKGQPEADLLTWRDLAQFYWPLGLTSLLSKLMPPLLSAVVARSPSPEVHLAAWPVAYGLLLVFTVPTQMLSQVVIPNAVSRYRREISMSFSRRVGVALSLALSVMAFTPVGAVYFGSIIGLQEPVLSSALLGFRFLAAVPLLQSMQNALYGAFSGLRSTVEIMVGSVLNMVIVIVFSLAVLTSGLPGTAAAAVLLSLGILAETGILTALLRRRIEREPEAFTSG